MISRTMDLASQLVGSNYYAVADVSEWESLTIQVIGLAGTCNIAGTNNGGDITGSVDGSPKNAADFNNIQAINLTTGTAVTAVTGTTLFRISPVSFKYLRLGDGASFAGTKVLVHCTKPY